MPANNRNSAAPKPASPARRLFERGVQRVAERPGLARQFVHIGQVAWAATQRNQVTRMAAALSYRTIFGLIPVLVVSLMLVTAYTPESNRRTIIYRVMDFAGLSQIAVAESMPMPPESVPGLNIFSGLNALEKQVSRAKVEPDGRVTLPRGTSDAKRQRLDDWIARLMGNIREFPFTVVGLVGLLTFLYAALSMIVEIEHSFNQICNAPEGRSWVRRLTQYWTLLTLGPVLLVISFGVTAAVRVWLEQALSNGAAARISFATPYIITLFTALPITTAMFMLIYVVVPNTRVHLGPAFLGAVSAAVFWELGKNAFAAYVTWSATYARLYGSLALIPLFLLWVYVTWLIVLMGLQLAASIQSYRIATAQGLTQAFLATLGLAEDTQPARKLRVVDPGAILVVALDVARRFASGKPSDHAQVAAATGVDEQVASDMLERMAGAGILHRVADADQEGTYSLARPPAQIAARSVLELADLLQAADRLAADPVMAGMIRARLAAVEGKTLADLLDLPVPPAPAPAPAPGPAEGRVGVPAHP